MKTNRFSVIGGAIGRVFVGRPGRLRLPGEPQAPRNPHIRIRHRWAWSAAPRLHASSFETAPPRITHIGPQHQAARHSSVKRLSMSVRKSLLHRCVRSATSYVRAAGGHHASCPQGNVKRRGRQLLATQPTQSTHKGLPAFLTSATRASRKASLKRSHCLLNPLRGFT